MDNILPFPSLGTAPPAADATQNTAESFHSECIRRFRAKHSARGISTGYTRKVLWTFDRLLKCSGKPVFELQESDYETWCEELATKQNLRHCTRRAYQRDIRQVIGYLCAANDLQNEAYRLFGRRMTLFAHEGNSIVHNVEDESASERCAMTHEEFQLLLDSMDEQIERALNENPREYAALARDKVAFFVIYLYGLRVSEVGGLQFRDWSANPHNPECGRYALLRVRFGKGAHGSGKRHRVVPSTDSVIVELLDWYRETVRPRFKTTEALKSCVFPSEQGKPLSASSIRSRLKKRHLIAAGLTDRSITPHCFRHTAVTHEAMRSGLEFARGFAGHKSGHTTQGYTHVPVEHVRARVRRIVDAQISDDRNARG